MTKFENPSFGTPANSKAYVDNYEKVFGKKKKASKKSPKPKVTVMKTAFVQTDETEKQRGI